jgi:hypothetical protein
LRPDAILAEIARARAVLAEREADVARLTEYIGTLELAAKMAGASLTSIREQRSVSPVDVNRNATMTAYTRRASKRSTRDHAGLKLLYEKDVTQASLARELNESRSRVVSWFATGALNRPIPRRHAEYLRDTYKVPLSAWERIAD